MTPQCLRVCPSGTAVHSGHAARVVFRVSRVTIAQTKLTTQRLLLCGTAQCQPNSATTQEKSNQNVAEMSLLTYTSKYFWFVG